jgi:S-formylglutathione hydrolase FrmB
MLLNERGIPTTVVLEPGGHDWSYWTKAMMDILAWHAARFRYEYDRPS